MKVGLIYDPIYLKHDTGHHPENAQRLVSIVSHLEETGLRQRLTPISPRPATKEELALVHRERYIAQIEEMARRGGGWLDMDTVMSADSYEAALRAAGGVLSATDAVIKGEVDSAFALVRPPGHHATPSQGMGFCLFNNIAIAAKYALTRYKLKTVLIIDFDVHHGNGTQDAFADDPQVVYISTHQYPHYPGTGAVSETGRGPAQGTTVNIPLPAGSGDGEYQQAFEEIIIPVTRRFGPELILVSAGYDAHWADQLAMMQVSTSGFARMVRIIQELANELSQGRLVLSLEGGYNLTALATSVKATFEVLLGERATADPMGEAQRRWPAPDIRPLLQKLKEIHQLP